MMSFACNFKQTETSEPIVFKYQHFLILHFSQSEMNIIHA